MSEISKLYENAGVEKLRYCFTGCEYAFCNSCDDCNVADKMVYPQFTAEKQLKLIKWLGERNILGTMRIIGKDKDWIMASESNMSWGVHKHVSRNKSFEETLAELINSLWRNLPLEEKQQIKEILSD